MSNHATLSPSSSSMWLECTPSALLNAQAGESASAYALEGTSAHILAEHKVNKALNRQTDDPRDNLDYYNKEMDECTDGYLQLVEERAQGADLIEVEKRLDLTFFIPGGFGTADCIVINGGKLSVIDLKYGTGVLIDAEKNSQLMCYGAGAVMEYSHLFDIKTVELIIFQPRREHFSSWEISTEELIAWAKEYLSPRARLASQGKGDFKPSETTCRWCKVKETCRARAEFYLELAREDFKPLVQLGNDEIAKVLAKVDGLVAWATDVKEYATAQAVAGVKYTGFKLVEGRSLRKYTDETAVAEAVTNAGYDPYEKRIKGITAMSKLLGKSFDEIIGSYVVKPSGKPTLVPETDKREEISTALDDFKEDFKNE